MGKCRIIYVFSFLNSTVWRARAVMSWYGI